MTGSRGVGYQKSGNGLRPAAMVALGSAAFLCVPARLIRDAFRELLTMSPQPTVLEPLRACALEVQ
ncbi:MAG TPA: hypothetical protein VGH89_18210, partial [Pseudonocardia sp.]